MSDLPLLHRALLKNDVPERHNAVKVLLFLDVGGSMDEHVRLCEELFCCAPTVATTT